MDSKANFEKMLVEINKVIFSLNNFINLGVDLSDEVIQMNLNIIESVAGVTYLKVKDAVTVTEKAAGSIILRTIYDVQENLAGHIIDNDPIKEDIIKLDLELLDSVSGKMSQIFGVV